MERRGGACETAGAVDPSGRKASILLPSWGQKERVTFIADHLLNVSGYTRIDDLSALLYVTPRQVSKDLALVRKRLGSYGVSVKSVPHHGMVAEGDEFDKRLCLSDLYAGDIKYLMALSRAGNAISDASGEASAGACDDSRTGSDDASHQIQVIRETLSWALRESGFRVSDMVYENMVVHLFIALERAKRGLAIGRMPFLGAEDEAFKVAGDIVNRLNRDLGVCLSMDERRYIAIHLKGKQSVDAAGGSVISPEVGETVVDLLEHIDDRYGTELKGDFQLRMNLNMHFEPMLYRIRSGLRQPNPMLEEIKRSYIYEFELAQEGCRVIEKRFRCKVSESEIGYIALYLRASLEKRFSGHRSRILLVCSTGRGTAELMRVRFETAFAPYIARLDLCSARDAEERDLEGYDFIFSTVPLTVDTVVPVIRVTCFLDGKDIADIGGVLRNPDQGSTFNRYFYENLFIPSLKAETKEDVLAMMVERIRSVRSIPDGFLDAVLRRESSANTSFGNGVAFPHPDEPLTAETFVCVAVLEKPVEWSPNQAVRLVLLASIEDAPRKHLQPLYGYLANVMGSAEGVEEVVKTKSFDSLKAVAVSD